MRILMMLACSALLALSETYAETNLATGKRVTASSQWSAEYGATMAVDGRLDTRWSAAGAHPGEWLEVDFGQAVQFNQVFIRQYGGSIQAYRIQYWKEATWHDAYRGGRMTAEQTDVFASVTSSRLRLLIVAAEGGVPSVWELEINDNPTAINVNGLSSNTMPAAPENLAASKTVIASSRWSDEYSPGKAVDRNFASRWSAADATAQWLEVDLGRPAVFNTLAFVQYGAYIVTYRVQYWVDGKWNDLHTGVDMPTFVQIVFPPVTGSKVRLSIVKAKGPSSIYEMEVVNDPFAEMPKPLVAPKKPSRSNPQAQQEIAFSALDEGRVFEGIGVLSAGGNTGLLKDYSEPFRSDILDFMFKPKFGAGFQHLKVEIGGGENSTCGSEPSHAITQAENANPKPRGFEFWLMQEARKRNPKILLDCLPWSFPAWTRGAFTQESADWFVSFLDCAKKKCGLELDYVGAGWNERGTDRDWVVNRLRPALNKAGYGKVKLQGPDHNGQHWKVFETFETDSAYRDALDVVSYHVYGLAPATEKAKASGKPLWMSECTGSGGLHELRQLIKFYVQDRITKFITWCPVASCYEGHTCFANVGFVKANQPWSGHYEVSDGVWYAAHVTQFTEPGWKLMDPGCRLFNPQDPKSDAGCLAFRDPKSDQWSLLAATAEPVTLKIKVGAGLSAGPVHVWKSGGKTLFVRQDDLLPTDGSVIVHLEAGSAYSLTTTTGQQKGAPPHPIPSSARFQVPYSEDFEHYELGAMPKYFMDQKGSFEVATDGRGGKCLKQIVPAEGTKWNGLIISPNTVFGDNLWESYELSSDVKVVNGQTEIGGRHDDMAKLGYRLTLEKSGKWTVSYRTEVIASGELKGFDGNVWHHLKIAFLRTGIKAFVDKVQVANLSNETRSMQGRCFLASSYDPNLFDNIRVNVLDAPLDPSRMKIHASSVYGPGNEAEKVLDGNPATIWHSGQSPAGAFNQSLVIDLGGNVEIDMVSYLPRQDSQTGLITAYNLYASQDGVTFTKIASGSWKKDNALKVATFTAVKAAFIKLEATEAGGGNMAAAASIHIYAHGTDGTK